MRGALERRQTCGDRVVAARFHFHIVRRICVHQMDRCAVKQSVDMLWVAAVAAEQAMLTQDPQVARLGDGCIRRRRNIVRIAEPFLHAGVEQLGQFVRVETQAAAGRTLPRRVATIRSAAGRSSTRPVRPSCCRRCGRPGSARASGPWPHAPAPSVVPASSAALYRVWPQMMTPSASTTIGWRKPNSRIEAATASTAASLMRGFLSYGRMSESFCCSILMFRAPIQVQTFAKSHG